MTPQETAKYYDDFNERSITPIRTFLWEVSVPESSQGTNEVRMVREVSREELDTLVLEWHQYLKTDPATYVIGRVGEDGEGYSALLRHEFQWMGTQDEASWAISQSYPYSTASIGFQTKKELTEVIDALAKYRDMMVD